MGPAEVILNQDLPLVDLPDVPREAGTRHSNLYYYTTSLDAWAVQGVRSKQKTAEYLVTSEAWEWCGMLQITRTVAQRVDTSIRPDSTKRVRVFIQMIVVPYRRVYSVGATLSLVEKNKNDK